jgi:hypothetical protein
MGRPAMMCEAREIRDSIHPKPLTEELLRSLRESLAHLEGLRMVNADSPEIVALKRSIHTHIRELEQRHPQT